MNEIIFIVNLSLPCNFIQKKNLVLPSSMTRSESPQPPSSPISPTSAAAIEAAAPSLAEDAAPSNNVLLTVNNGQFDSFIRIGTGGRNNFALGLIAGSLNRKDKRSV